MESPTSIVPVYRALRGRGYEVLVSHPKKTRLIAESRIKTDRVDSERAFPVRMRSKPKVKIKAQLVVNGLTPPSEHGLFTFEERRDLFPSPAQSVSDERLWTTDSYSFRVFVPRIARSILRESFAISWGSCWFYGTPNAS